MILAFPIGSTKSGSITSAETSNTSPYMSSFSINTTGLSSRIAAYSKLWHCIHKHTHTKSTHTSCGCFTSTFHDLVSTYSKQQLIVLLEHGRSPYTTKRNMISTSAAALQSHPSTSLCSHDESQARARACVRVVTPTLVRRFELHARGNHWIDARCTFTLSSSHLHICIIIIIIIIIVDI